MYISWSCIFVRWHVKVNSAKRIHTLLFSNIRIEEKRSPLWKLICCYWTVISLVFHYSEHFLTWIFLLYCTVFVSFVLDQWTVSREDGRSHDTTVHFILVFQAIFCDNFFITSYFKLKLSWCVSMLFMKVTTKFRLDPTVNEKFPHIPPF